MTAKKSLRSQRLWLGKPLFETLALASSCCYMNNANATADMRYYSVTAVLAWKRSGAVMMLLRYRLSCLMTSLKGKLY